MEGGVTCQQALPSNSSLLTYYGLAEYCPARISAAKVSSGNNIVFLHWRPSHDKQIETKVRISVK
jgi:hypothetical protein